MMREILGVSDEPGARRRWFHDDYFDLFVWEADGGEVLLFQLCYGIHSSEQAVVWHRDSGFFHDGLRSAGGWRDQIQDLAERFAESAPTLPKMIRQTIASRLREYARSPAELRARRVKFRRDGWQKRLLAEAGSASSSGRPA